ncbi:hypothetical protein HanRHA438_Chr15g0715031 [Helianthus annuus]|uniref:Uncharacterized protein n=1 Tax=Helianthus annuus TaxID=4232 RepID=A0A251SAL8_HELAN|nr:hypothetical protein HanXRQr2_Chr15g0702691 [Helianthus annuus]KAJ0832043.1 hypothetical protein HanPSC8_Chr15g0674201 [Helianthus annuus]KAJ0845556.1 hypothetical protein HanRHA438_Chr15g0715031 [Helianthus annuus]
MCHDMNDMKAWKMMWHHLRHSRNWFWLQYRVFFSSYGYTRDPDFDPCIYCF